MMKKTYKYTILLIILLGGGLLINHFTEFPNYTETPSQREQKSTEKEDKYDTDTRITFNREPAHPDANYFEGTTVIDEQPMYYAYPLEIDTNSPPQLILYSHGQLQRIVEDKNEKYMEKLREYAGYFASKGYAFSASNEHGDNWGGTEALGDMQNSIEWLEQEGFKTADKIHLIGFSMGGLSTVNFAIENSADIASMTFLAPTPRLDLGQSELDSLKNIPIKIFHGQDDVNIPLNNSIQYVELLENNQIDTKLNIIENAAHYDVEFDFMSEIEEFMNSSYSDH